MTPGSEVQALGRGKYGHIVKIYTFYDFNCISQQGRYTMVNACYFMHIALFIAYRLLWDGVAILHFFIHII